MKKGGKYIGVVDVMGILRHIDFLVIKHGAETEKAIKELSDTTAGQLLGACFLLLVYFLVFPPCVKSSLS